MPAYGAIGRHLARVADLAERHGQRCGGPVLLAGMVVGLGNDSCNRATRWL